MQADLHVARPFVGGERFGHRLGDDGDGAVDVHIGGEGNLGLHDAAGFRVDDDAADDVFFGDGDDLAVFAGEASLTSSTTPDVVPTVVALPTTKGRVRMIDKPAP